MVKEMLERYGTARKTSKLFINKLRESLYNKSEVEGKVCESY
ncbi:MAG: hypothetical protein ACPLZF_04290 [Nitrososphaeria archaeon]